MLFIGVLSAAGYEARRQACRDTWFNKLRNRHVYPLFLVGGYTGQGNWMLSRDVLYLKCPDDYASLPQKTRMFCQFAAGCSASHIFKCDDDTYVQPDRL